MLRKELLIGWMLVFVTVLGSSGGVLLAASEGSSDSVFRLKEVSVFEYDGPRAAMLQSGAYSMMESEASPTIKAVPDFVSGNVLYGVLMADMSLAEFGAATEYRFAIDESKGTGKGYDKLYFDINHDLDLTNDTPIGIMADPPKPLKENTQGARQVVFDYVSFDLQYRDGTDPWPVKLLPSMISYNDSSWMARFIVPTARVGKIEVAGEEFEAVLTQSGIVTGRYDRPITYLYLGEKDQAIPVACLWRSIGGKLYRFESSPAGDEIRPIQYQGDFGTIDIGEGSMPGGYLMTGSTMVDLGECESTGGKFKVPVGDYKPLQLMTKVGNIRVTIAANRSEPGEPAKPAVFGIPIRKDKTFALSFANKPKIVFTAPASDATFKPDDEVRVSAMLHESGMDVLVAGIEDMSKPSGEPIDLADGTKYQRYETLDPMVRVVNSSGDVLAEDRMPFG